MGDSYDREIVREETSTGDPVRPAPAAPVTSSHRSVYREGSYNTRAVQAGWWFVGFIDVLIAIRCVLKLCGSNGGVPFVCFIYDFTVAQDQNFYCIVSTPLLGDTHIRQHEC